LDTSGNAVHGRRQRPPLPEERSHRFDRCTARSLFQTTSKPVPASHDKGAAYHTIAQAGAGLIDAYAALTTTTILSPGQFELNDTEHFNPV